MKLARYYVAKWGGIKRNSDAILSKYVTDDPVALAGRGKTGIASWSKVLCIRDPAKYAIFDARVSASLNCLQISNPVIQPAMFPCLSTQNADVKEANKNIRSIAAKNCWPQANKLFYQNYLLLIGAAPEACGTCIQTIEMVLFSSTIDFIKELPTSD
jgi:hypothetical protein